MDLNFSVFQEPRGVMRVLHFIFSICAFATITGYTGFVNVACKEPAYQYQYEYPFSLELDTTFKLPESNSTCHVKIAGNFSSDAKFFVTTGVLAMLYSIAIIVVYLKFDEMYKTNTKLPLYDFIVTVIFGVLWISSSAAWANGVSGLKFVTQHIDYEGSECAKSCQSTASSFSTLNISVIFGFLNFFLWAADLWFLYKETAWFQTAQTADPGV